MKLLMLPNDKHEEFRSRVFSHLAGSDQMFQNLEHFVPRFGLLRHMRTQHLEAGQTKWVDIT